MAEDRALEGGATQQAAREEAYVQKVNELQKMACYYHRLRKKPENG
ncbi:hypothetical protein ACSDVA_002489 [Listeria monocytogenes]